MIVEPEGLNEFQWGEVFSKIESCLEKDIGEIVGKIPEAYRGEAQSGLNKMLGRVRDVFTAVSDGVVRERAIQAEANAKIGNRVNKVEEEIQVVKDRATRLSEDSLNLRIRRSETEMERKVKASCCSVKLQDMEFGSVIEDKRTIVKTAISILKSDVHPEDRFRFDRILRRTRVVILGRRTEVRHDRGRSYYTVPVLLELGNQQEAEEIGEILRRVGYFSSFHWPGEIMDFIYDIRAEMRESGYGEDSHFVRIRPEIRGGEVQLRADVKGKDGGRWVAKAFWYCPPLDRNLWELVDGLYTPKLVNNRG